MASTLGEEIREIREKQNISREELAESMHIKVETLCKWEDGESLPHINRIPDLKLKLSCSFSQLLKKGYLPDSFIPEASEAKKASLKILKVSASHKGSRINLNLPLTAVKFFVSTGKLNTYLEGTNKDELKEINWDNILLLAESGTMGKLFSKKTENSQIHISVE